ncbi:hypothetical protein QO179_05060 [Bacillus stercoris]|nr:hypothetical protein [Bacillus stercoris]
MAKKLSGHLVGEDGKPYQHGFFLHEEKGIVMDAKYKSGWEQGYVVDDLHQIFSYMFLKGNHHGGVIYPVPHNSFHQAAKSESIATELQVHHGPYRFHRLPFVILSTSQTMADFLKGMKDSINGWNEKYTSQVQNKP